MDNALALQNLVVHIVCGIIATGMLYASLQRGRHYRPSDCRYRWIVLDRTSSVLAIFGGILSLIVLLLLKHYKLYETHGWLWPFGKKARLEAEL
ncbi:MAG: hypothetical protein HGA67_04415 [Candidatus Yonathbacteria bacterium]|nr:hypothetical protein [Candidatus Yonathbacteria bacterium]